MSADNIDINSLRRFKLLIILFHMVNNQKSSDFLYKHFYLFLLT